MTLRVRIDQFLQRKESGFPVFIVKLPDQAGVLDSGDRVSDEVMGDQRIQEDQRVFRRVHRLVPFDVHHAAALRNQHVMIRGVGVVVILPAMKKTVVQCFNFERIVLSVEFDQAFRLVHSAAFSIVGNQDNISFEICNCIPVNSRADCI